MKYIKKTCVICGEKFERPSTWRRTQWCPECSWLREQYSVIARQLAKRMKMRGDLCCEKCGATNSIEAHHKVPLNRGGGIGPHNIMWLCYSCHVEHHNKHGIRAPQLTEKFNE